MKRALTFVVIFIAILAAGLIVYRVRALQSSMSTMPTGVPTTSAVAPTPTPRGDVVVDPRRQQLIGVRMVTAGRSEMTPTIRAAGTVQYAETRQSEINLKLDGWIRELFVDYTGQPITKGQPIFTLYSPDLLATENEYLLAVKTREQLQGSQIPDARERADQLVVSARQRLTLWDLPESELRSLDNEH